MKLRHPGGFQFISRDAALQKLVLPLHARSIPRLVGFQSRRNALRCAAEQEKKESMSLSDLISFESSKRASTAHEERASSREAKGSPDEIIGRASKALEAARAALEAKRQQSPAEPRSGYFQYSSNRQDRRGGPDAAQRQQQSDIRRADLERLLAGADRDTMSWDGEEESTSDKGRGDEQPSWSQNFLSEGHGDSQSGSQLQRKSQEEAAKALAMDFAEPELQMFDYISQDAQDIQAARRAQLPPLQSVTELTSASAPPQRGEAPVTAQAATSSAGQVMEDGEGVLADGTRYIRESGEDFGANGFWKRWTRLAGVSAQGKVEWEEKWWDVSDWAGMKEMGAEKSGCRADGAAWRETWREAISYDQQNGEPMVERSAHKWACDAKGDEWEEKWGEQYWNLGRANKFADKWGREGTNVWHERWGEDYDGSGGCFKYTDKWAERLLEGGGNEQWGENWEERFKDGSGSKKGETWSVDANDERYQRWWGEDHFGNGWVRKHGNSNTGEQWDVSEQMDTYYNPIPHFDYRLALNHSPTLRRVPVLPRGGNELGTGIDDL